MFKFAMENRVDQDLKILIKKFVFSVGLLNWVFFLQYMRIIN